MPATFKFDDPFGFIRPVQDGPTQVAYPFLGRGDRGTKAYTRSLLQRASSYVPAVLGFERDSVWEGGDPAAYLIAETSPEPAGVGDLVRFSRTYARIPPDQVTYLERQYLGKPEYSPTDAFNPFDVASGLAVSVGNAFSFSQWSTTYGAASYSSSNGIYTIDDGSIYAGVKVPSSQTAGRATAGTFTLSYGGDTTAALAYNAAASTIDAALNGLAAVVSAGITFASRVGTNYIAATSGGMLQWSVTGGTEAARQSKVTVNVGGLTISTSAHAATAVIGSSQQWISLPTHLAISGHGFDSSKSLALIWGSANTMIVASGDWGVIDANTIWVPNYSNNTLTASYAGIYSGTLVLPGASTYTAGIRFPRRRLTEKFYLPGVTAGISAVTDIPVPADLQNPNDFLTMLLSVPSGYEVYRVEGPSPWLDGPIYRVAIEELYFPDLV